VAFGVVLDPMVPVELAPVGEGVGVLDMVPLLPVLPLLPMLVRLAQAVVRAAARHRPSRAGTRAYFLEAISKLLSG
jgi:hypothetical protein